jgi:hypothetical protein
MFTGDEVSVSDDLPPDVVLGCRGVVQKRFLAEMADRLQPQGLISFAGIPVACECGDRASSPRFGLGNARSVFVIGNTMLDSSIARDQKFKSARKYFRLYGVYRLPTTQGT